MFVDRRDGVVVRASASQSIDPGFIPLVESYQKNLKHGIHSFPAWRSALGKVVENKPASSLVVSLGKALNGDAPAFMWKTGGPVFPQNRGLVAGRASDRKTNAMY